MKVISLPIGLAISIILARALGPKEFGQYAFAMSLISIIGLSVSGGIPQLLTREISGYVLTNNWSLYRGAIRAFSVWVVLISTLIILAYWLIGFSFKLLAVEGKWSLLNVGLFMLPLIGIASVRKGVTKGLSLPVYAEMPGLLIQPTVIFLIISFFAWRDWLSSETAIFSQFLGCLVVFLVTSLIFNSVQPPESRKADNIYEIQVWRSSLLPFALISLISTLNIHVGILMLGVFSVEEQIAAMRIAERGGQLVVMALTLVNIVIAPHIVRAFKDGDKLLLQKLVHKTARGSFFLALPVTLSFVLFGGSLVGFVFGEQYSEISYIPLVIVSIGQLFNVFFGSVGLVLMMGGFEKRALNAQILSLAINMSLCIILVPLIGAIGSAIAVTVGLIVWNVFLWVIVKRQLGIMTTAI